MRTLFLILVLVSGCRTPDYITPHGAHVYHNCSDPDYQFPTKGEMSAYLDFMVENVSECLPVEPWLVSAVLANADIHLECKPRTCKHTYTQGELAGQTVEVNCGGKHYDRYFRDEYIVWWEGYLTEALYHEIMHQLHLMLYGVSGRDHLDAEFWAGDRCLLRLFEEA